MSETPVTEADLHAYVDGVLPPERVEAVESHLANHPEDALRVSAWREQNLILHRAYDPVLSEPLPGPLARPLRAAWPMYGAAAALFVAGVATGWWLHGYNAGRQLESTTWAKRAAIAHVVYSPEVRHPVEVSADQEAHLVAWLSKRLGTPLTIPHLGKEGYSLVGGRLLPGDRGPVAQFMYQDDRGQRLTLYVRLNADDSRETAFRFAQERGVGVFYWLDRRLGYALSGEVSKEELLRVATSIYQQLNP